MFSRQEHCASDQILCWNCEEAVHQTVIVCPYCNVEIHRHPVQKVSEQTKITALSQPGVSSVDHGHVVDTGESPAQTLRFLGSLFLLLLGSSLFFLAILIALFSRGGCFTLSWPEHSWSAFFGLGLALLAFGTMVFQKLPGASEET